MYTCAVRIIFYILYRNNRVLSVINYQLALFNDRVVKLCISSPVWDNEFTDGLVLEYL